MKLAAIVVTYNRKQLLLECLEALRKQTYPIDAIFIVDNFSYDDTPEILFENKFINQLPPKELKEPWENEFEISYLTNRNPIKINYVRMHENIGGAGGFHEGVKKAYEMGYDWFWLMDDDSEPEITSLSKISKYFNNKDTVALAQAVYLPIGSIIYGTRGTVNFYKIFPMIQTPIQGEKYKSEFVEVDTASFVGIFIRREAVESIGLPLKNFFIYHDDIEYCLRLRKVGKILLIPESIIFHKDESKGNYEIKHFINKKFKRIEYQKLWLQYYGKRNLTWLGTQYATSKIIFYIQLLKNILRTIFDILIFDDYKFKRIKLYLCAYMDGLIGNFDNKKPRKILYNK